MREILFRGKRLDNGGWVEGDLSHCVVVGETYICRIEDNLSTTTHGINHETVCQYTGLTDKNGRKIFERDICEFSVFDYNGHDMQYRGAVVYVGSRFMLWKSKDSEYYGADGGFDLDWTVAQDDEFEVIGNIFDIPELIE